jgi:kynureninase
MSLPKTIDSPALAKHYAAFKVSERILLTGHSHQAWPDVALEGLEQSFRDAALHVDEKWSAAFEQAEHVRRGFRELLGGIRGDIALAPNTHELLVRLISAIPGLLSHPRETEIVATRGEFHTARRQLLRLEEEGLPVRWIDAEPFETVGLRMAEALSTRTKLAICSTVFFETGRLAGGLKELATRAENLGTMLLLDTYHHLNALPFDPTGLETAFLIGGGYKYLQLGEGNCFLRSPEGSELRPIYTGWFADFSALAQKSEGRVGYGSEAGARFAGATYDPASHYRAASVLRFFKEQELTPDRLRARSLEQLSLLARGIDALGLPQEILSRDQSAPLEAFGGFLSLQTPHAEHLEKALAREGVLTDHRGNRLRLGPAPYLSDAQLEDALRILDRVIRRERFGS